MNPFSKGHIGTKKKEVIHIKILTDKYTSEASCSARGSIIEKNTCMTEKINIFQKPKTRVDQSYRLFGEVSTSFFKFWEIIEAEKWTFTQSGITLAEGEGSMAYLLLQLGCTMI